jgi:peptidoglycan/LPS O-acetylase OafA/YrhL
MVISGFILAHIAAAGEIDTRSFYLNRILRIYPLFIFIVALGYFVTPDPRETQAGADFLLALLPISNLYRLHYGAYGGMLWSVAVELQFYLLFPFLWRLLRLRGLPLGFALIGFMIGVRALAYLSTGAAYDLDYFSLFGCLDAFVIGAMTQLAYARMPKPMPSWWPVAALIGVTLLAYGQLHSPATGAVWILWPTILPLGFAGLLVTYLAARRGIVGSSVIAFVGRVSFSMYAWQYVVFGAVRPVLPRDGRFDAYTLGLLVAILGVLPVAAASYFVIEKPFLDMRVRYIKPTPAREREPLEAAA